MQITISRRLLVAVFIFAVAVASVTGYARGVAAQTPRPVQPIAPYPVQPILSGDDIGFRPLSADSPRGTLMIRVDGKWREAQVVVPVMPGVPGIRPLN